MKIRLTLFMALAISLNALAQIKECYPNGFRRAELPPFMKNKGVRVSYFSNPGKNINGISGNTHSISRANPISSNRILADTELFVGCTFYDLQTNNSVNNLIEVNNDNTISLVYSMSPDAIQTTFPPFSHRFPGYNYYNGSVWNIPSGCPTYANPTSFLIESPNIVVTPSGKEMIVAQTISYSLPPIDSMHIIILWRAMKGANTWDTIMFPWGNQTLHSLPKACGGITNENVYVIFQGTNGLAPPDFPVHMHDGYYGPIYFSKSTDGGLTWSPAIIIPEIDSTHYFGFSGDSYSIDAIGDTVAISFGNTFTDIGLLKSTDAGQSWTKYIIQQHPQPLYNPYTDSLTDLNHNGVIDTISSNGNDSKVLIDNNGMCHVWFSSFRYLNDSVGDSTFTGFYDADNLFYWNETMLQNNGYVAIARAQDFNGNGIIDVPHYSSPNCQRNYPWGQYGGGITQMPSAGINSNGTIFLSYQTIDEMADTTFYHFAHRHVYIMSLDPPYNPINWSYPYDIIPSISAGGDGEYEEGVFASTARRVDNNFAYVLYQRDNAPGYAFVSIDSCDMANNLNNSSDLILCKVDINQNILGIDNPIANELFVSQNYPNPSHGMTSIDVGTRKSSEIKIEVNDFTGRIVYKTSQGILPAGTNTIRLNTGTLSPGIYTYTVLSDGLKMTRRMIID